MPARIGRADLQHEVLGNYQVANLVEGLVTGDTGIAAGGTHFSGNLGAGRQGAGRFGRPGDAFPGRSPVESYPSAA